MKGAVDQAASRREPKEKCAAVTAPVLSINEAEADTVARGDRALEERQAASKSAELSHGAKERANKSPAITAGEPRTIVPKSRMALPAGESDGARPLAAGSISKEQSPAPPVAVHAIGAATAVRLGAGATDNSQQPIANSQQPIANSQQPIANSQQPIADSQQPIANSQQPTANRRRATAAAGAMEKLRAGFEAARAAAGAALRDIPLEELEKRCRGHKLGTNGNGWVNPFAKDDPRSLYLEYQFAWAYDRARFKAGLQSRQSGKDFSSEGEAAEDCNARKTEWMIAAPSERQALDSLDQGKTWAEAFDLKVADYQEYRPGGSETVLKAAEIIFSNGSRMRAVPGRPDTVRGRSANLLLTEFDFFEDPAATWRSVLPSITNPLRGGEKKVRLITTPNGIGSAMHKIWTAGDGKRMKWSRHLVTIYHAVLMGLPVDIEEVREAMQAMGDFDGFSQEYLCQFIDAASVLLPYELIAACESVEASEGMPAEYWDPGIKNQFPVDLGVDFGRKRDITVCWAAEKVGDMQITKEVLCLEKMPTPQQVDVLRPRIRKARRVALDYTGPGIGMGDYLVQEHGEWNPAKHQYGKVELITMSNTMKVELFGKLRMAYEKRSWRVPISTTIREDLHGIYRCVTPTGNITYRAPHTEDGHSDRGTAQALCTRAGGDVAGVIFTSALI